MKISIIIPVYNEVATIEKILNRLEEVNFSPAQKEIIIVDDFSSDGTREILKNHESRHLVFYHEKNQGKGMAIRTALPYVSGDIVTIQDADLEYNPNDLKIMVKKIINDPAVLVVYGSRRLNRNYLQYRRSGHFYAFGGIFLTWLTNVLYGLELTDQPTCYKMFRADLLKSLDLESRRFEFCSEVTAKIAKKGITIHEVPIDYFPRHKDEGKKIKFIDGAQAVRILLKNRFLK